MSGSFVIEDPRGFPDTIAMDHGRSDYEGQEENSIEYNEDEDQVEVSYGSSESLEALYDWICETKQAYNKAFHAGEYEAAEQLEKRIYKEKDKGRRNAIAEESQEKFVELVEGEIERGDPVKVVMEGGESHLTFFGWFPTHGVNPGGMMICSREEDKLVDSRAARRIRSENVEKIIPLEERPDNE